MASSNNNELISRASLHTQKKFELIEKYIMPWAQKLMNNRSCKGLVFIDCMCNSGLYHDDNGELIEGTPIRVARVLRNIAGQYPDKRVLLYFNDLDAAKTALLHENVPKDTPIFISKSPVKMQVSYSKPSARSWISLTSIISCCMILMMQTLTGRLCFLSSVIGVK